MIKKTDVLVIGSGIAGLFAALKCANFAQVTIVTKKQRTESNTNYAQGGIAGVMDPKDSYEKHIEDTIIAGANLGNRKMIEILVKEGPDRIKELMELGARFTKKDGKLDLAREGGHSMNRIVHADDLTGAEVERALMENVLAHPNIELYENHFTIDLITEHNIKEKRNAPIENRNCWGAYVLDATKNQVITILSKVTILASGGAGQVYQHTTNPRIATGDGFAMAYRAGAKIGNMEFIQFHPTAFYSPIKESIFSNAFLISEAVRGFGAKLINQSGEEFMYKYDERKELAPRDIVARAIDSELKRTGDNCVYLSLAHKNKDEIIEHFPNIYQSCLQKGVDITKDLIPVVPAAHYTCGGVVVDENSKTSLENLYACGEVSMTGVHGANRLASNSLLEAIVFSHRAALDIRDKIKNKTICKDDVPAWDESETISADEKVLVTHSINEVKQVMWDYVGIVRSNLRLERAFTRIHNLYVENEELYKKTKIFEELLELRNLTAVAHMIIKCARMRRESRGLHYNIDYGKEILEPKDTIIVNRNY
jgi:L-aspartate oxidase